MSSKAADKTETNKGPDILVKQHAGKELHTSDLEVGQLDPVLLPYEGDIARDTVIEPLDSQAGMKYIEDLSFYEEPVTISLSPPNEKNPPKVVDCWVNGKGIEVFLDNKWREMGAIPYNVPVTVKRKYVEVLARSKFDAPTTRIEKETGEKPENYLDHSVALRAPFSVLQDRNPRGAEWLRRVLAERA